MSSTNGVLTRGISPPGITIGGPPAIEYVPVQFVVRLTVLRPAARYVWLSDVIGYAPPASLVVSLPPSPKSHVHDASTFSVTCTPSNVSLKVCVAGVLVANSVGRFTIPPFAGCCDGRAVVSN